jgi:hypothetical protein
MVAGKIGPTRFKVEAYEVIMHGIKYLNQFLIISATSFYFNYLFFEEVNLLFSKYCGIMSSFCGC